MGPIFCALINVAKKIFPNKAKNFSVGTLLDQKVDVCFMNSVAAYMSSNELLRVIHEVKCDQLVLLDVKNKDFEEELILAQAKRQGLTIQEREDKYKETPITHYHKNYFNFEKYQTRFLPMPSYFPDAEFQSYCVIIKKLQGD